jgi:hypothetical protein
MHLKAKRASVSVLLSVFVLSPTSINSARADGFADAWANALYGEIIQDWNPIIAHSIAFDLGHPGSLLGSTRLQIIRGDDDNICNLTLTPAYTRLAPDGSPEIRFCLNNFGRLEAFVEGVSLRETLFEGGRDPDLAARYQTFIDRYLSYLLMRADSRKPYCEAGRFLFFMEMNRETNTCGDDGRLAIDPQQAQFHQWNVEKKATARAWFSRDYTSAYHHIPTDDEYDEFLVTTFADYRRWSWRAVLFHEIGHIVNHDFGGEGAGTNEIADDNVAIAIAKTVRQTDHMLQPILALIFSLEYMSAISSYERGEPANFDVPRITNLIRQLNELADDLRNHPSSGHLASGSSFAFVFGDCAAYRHLHETYNYACPPRVTMKEYNVYVRPEYPFVWDGSSVEFLFTTPY